MRAANSRNLLKESYLDGHRYRTPGVLIRQQIEKGKTERARAEANLESLEKQRKEIEAELAELGVKPENLDAEIERLKSEIEAGLSEAEKLLQNGEREQERLAF